MYIHTYIHTQQDKTRTDFNVLMEANNKSLIGYSQCV